MKSFHPEELALLAAIHADPREDSVRLAYADWLQEHDQPEYAEFIRLQVERAAKANAWSPDAYTKRERALIQSFGARWRGHRLTRDGFIDRSNDLRFCMFHRGLPEAHLSFWNDSRRKDRAEAVRSKLGAHYQLCVTFNFVQADDQPGLARGLFDPVFVRAHRIHIRALASGAPREVPLAGRYAVSAVEILRVRRLAHVSFGPLSTDAFTLIERELTPYVPTDTNLPSVG